MNFIEIAKSNNFSVESIHTLDFQFRCNLCSEDFFYTDLHDDILKKELENHKLNECSARLPQTRELVEKSDKI